MDAPALNLIPSAGFLAMERPAWAGDNRVWNRFLFPAYTSGNMERAPESPSRDDDEQLLLKVAEGNRTAFGALYDRFSTPIYSLALKMLANEAEARVVAQARNRAIDRIRSMRRRGQLVEAHLPELEPSGSVVTSSAQNAELSERGRHVRAALEQLSDEQRRVLRLAFFEGLTQVEIAEKLAEPLGTIKARAHRGLVRLRAVLRFLHE